MGITTLIRENNPYETVATHEDIQTQHNESLERFVENLPSSKEFAQNLVGETANALSALIDVKEKLDMPNRQAFEFSNKLLGATQEYFKKHPDLHQSWETTRRGILGEVCVRTTLKRIGFSVKAPTNEEDHSKIDLWVDPKEEEGHVWAVQIKARSSREANFPIVTRLAGNAHDQGYIPIEIYDEEQEIREAMNEYLNSGENEYPNAEGIIIWVSSDESFKRNGEPTPGFEDVLYDKIAESFGWNG